MPPMLLTVTWEKVPSPSLLPGRHWKYQQLRETCRSQQNGKQSRSHHASAVNTSLRVSQTGSSAGASGFANDWCGMNFFHRNSGWSIHLMSLMVTALLQPFTFYLSVFFLFLPASTCLCWGPPQCLLLPSQLPIFRWANLSFIFSGMLLLVFSAFKKITDQPIFNEF